MTWIHARAGAASVLGDQVLAAEPVRRVQHVRQIGVGPELAGPHLAELGEKRRVMLGDGVLDHVAAAVPEDIIVDSEVVED
ncbi:hypothetical protein [Streptomyces sp. NBC_00576]|uniref:hypothetical protein n=1 Tax=Streptomyces sp. NBC_00576 TaxID=2903665 RepID=UPI002E8137C2|nr:hypothetical protein [Streptomyces sp. NBC_00576]WUB77693.1 hypothetical protein OG734_47555 [Streptomyces sp. NBC_00576]